MTPVERWMNLGVDGFVVSIVYGPCGHLGIMFSVNVMCPDGQEFMEPFAANSLEQCVNIAENEIAKRGWAKQ